MLGGKCTYAKKTTVTDKRQGEHNGASLCAAVSCGKRSAIPLWGDRSSHNRPLLRIGVDIGGSDGLAGNDDAAKSH